MDAAGSQKPLSVSDPSSITYTFVVTSLLFSLVLPLEFPPLPWKLCALSILKIAICVEFKVYQNFHFPLGNTKTLEHSENIAPRHAYFLSLCVFVLSIFFSETTKCIVLHSRHTSAFRSTCAFVTVFVLHSSLCFHLPSGVAFLCPTYNL